VVGAYMFELIDDRRAHLGADLLSRLLVAEHEGEALTDDEVL
jgi:cytochrome P450